MRTRNHILRVSLVIVLNEAEAIHEFNLNDVSTAVFLEEIFDLLFPGCYFSC
jgi:hypothetical protein